MVFARLITAGIVRAIFVGGPEITAGCGAVFVDGAMSVFADAAAKGRAFILVFNLSALHAAIGGVQIYSEFYRYLPYSIGFSFAPIKGDAKRRATGAAAKAWMLFV